jgi:hypothetical protein
MTRVLLRSRTALWLGAIGIMALGTGPVQAQYSSSSSPGTSSTAMPNYNFSGAGSYFGGTSALVPFGGAMGGFLPYSPGLGGGLGVQPAMPDSAMQMPPGGMRMLGTRPSLGLIRSATTPLAPISIGGMGSRSFGRIGSMAEPIRRSPAGGSMGGMPRPPVGNYPFRQPPSLVGPSTAAPSMSM